MEGTDSVISCENHNHHIMYLVLLFITFLLGVLGFLVKAFMIFAVEKEGY